MSRKLRVQYPGAVLAAILPPVITRQPQSQTVPWGNRVLFTVSASGTRPLSYQWRFNEANIVGATNAALTRYSTPSQAQMFDKPLVRGEPKKTRLA